MILLLGMFLGLWFGEFFRRPRLSNAGTSGAGSTGHPQVFTLRVANAPAMLGAEVRPTVLFGRRLHGTRILGLPVSRHAAVQCRASLYDRGSREFIAPLHWLNPGAGGDPYVDAVTIEPGQEVNLPVFSTVDSATQEYFPFAPPDPTTGALFRPAGTVRFNGSRQFYIRFQLGYGGREDCRLNVAVRAPLRGGLEWPV